MRITRLVLEGYKRLGLSGIKRLEWSPDAPYQIILGTNGSGKSSLMAELSPNPAQVSDYHKGGSKLVELEHNHQKYVLTSTFAAGGRHSFVLEGRELNEGGTQAIQKELVKEHFDYDQETHDILTMSLRFTRMTTAERRKLITRLSRADYTFAIRLHDRLASAARDMKGHLKHVRIRLHDETLALGQMTDAEGIEERVRQLQADLSALLYARSPAEQPTYAALRDMEGQVNALEHAGTALLRAADQIDLQGQHRTSQELEHYLNGLENEVTIHDSILERLKVEFSEVESLLHSMDASHLTDLTDLNGTIIRLQTAHHEALDAIREFPHLRELEDPHHVLMCTENILARAIQVFSELPDNSDRRFSRENLDKAQAISRESVNAIDHGEGAVRLLKQRLHVIEHTPGQECPQCKFTWVPGLDKSEVAEIERKINAFNEAAVLHKQRIDESDKYLEAMEDYTSHYRQWRLLEHEYMSLEPLWRYIRDRNYQIEQPSQHLDVFHAWLAEVTQASHAKRIEEELKQVEKIAKSAQGGEGAHFRQRLQKLEAEISQRTVLLRDLRQVIVEKHRQRVLFVALEQSASEWEQAITGLESAYDRALAALATETVDAEVTRTQGQLGALQHTLNAKQVLEGVIADLKQSLEKAEIDHDALSLLAAELSPKEGLIAEQLHGFIKCLTAQLNSVIASVWTYDLEVLPCDMDGGDLTYRFPMYTGSTDQTVKDVSEGSTSIMDIVDFAVQQTVMLYLGFTDYPLFVDELGASFDEQHRANVNRFLAQLMESQRYSQVFMISHYVAGWGSFNNAEYLVLDSRNIAVPDNHNTHAVLA